MMRICICLLFVTILLLGLVIGSDTRPKNRNKGNRNGEKEVNDREQQNLKVAVEAVENFNEDVEENSKSMNGSKIVPLPKKMELVQDETVGMGPMQRRFSGEGNSRLSCRGTVQGTTSEGATPYYRYIKVDTSSCLHMNIVYPRSFRLTNELNQFTAWQPTVTQLLFVEDNSGAQFRIPKRLSKPTNVTMDPGSSDSDYRGNREVLEEERLASSFGFAVFFPSMDQQVRWNVEWQLDACSPFGFNCSDAEEDYKQNAKYDENAFSISKEDGYEIWNFV